ncbi:hypothetical protein N656DRAFT_779381 [Canariomyces notabilis]|uniref:Uncharacterized protein n=1 Tax=Canariomyces notabilis TaxID=2074819 RepID=A0AAN6TDT8_9PEZI|nr:hypothetical protein N656DRAFT_779381 [Canariomyces arenarius]
MPSFTSRHFEPEGLGQHSKSTVAINDPDDAMEDIIQYTPRRKDAASKIPDSLALVPSDGSLLDYFDLPSPPSTPQRPTHNLSYSSLNSFSSPMPNPGLSSSPPTSRRSSISSSSTSSPSSSPPTTSIPRWPTASQRTPSFRLPRRARSRSTSSCSSADSLASLTLADNDDIEMAGTVGTASGVQQPYVVRAARRTPYYPPNSSRNIDRARVYMNRGPHYIANWTPLSSLPRHVQLQIEEKMVRFTAI